MNEKDIEDPIGESLNIMPMKNVEIEKSQNVEILSNDGLDQDFESARSNIHDMINTASDAITDLSTIAKQSQHPRAFEVLAKLIETSVKASKDLLDIQEKIKQIKNIEKNNSGGTPKTVNQSIFVGSTSELSKIVNMFKKGNEGNVE